MLPLKTIFVISVLISGLIFSPSYSFAQSNQDDNPLSSFFEFFRQLFSFDDDSETVIEFRDATIVQTSGTSSTDTTPNNIAPIANAGLNQTVLEFATVTLDGSSSTDVDGTIVSYLWTQLSGKQVVILSPTNVNATFIAPEVNSSGEILEFSLAVVDNSSGTDTDEVKITVNKIDAGSGGDGPGGDGPGGDGPGGDGPGGDGPGDEGPENNDNDGKNKVTICHIPPGNPDNAHTITVGEPAVITHMTQHGDTLGECPTLSGENSENNSNDGDKSNKENKGNSGKGNSDIDNSGKGNKNDKDENKNKKDNSDKGNSGVENSGKGNKNDKDDNEKSNSGKGNKNDNENKSNSKLKNNNDDEAKVEDNEHEDEDDEMKTNMKTKMMMKTKTTRLLFPHKL
ncbi:MAG: hypothetical protein IIA19_07020 [Thaumarchaeota archaeon]|nr:hypothetical protein [Nitrososphaerota archaeon]